MPNSSTVLLSYTLHRRRLEKTGKYPHWSMRSDSSANDHCSLRIFSTFAPSRRFSRFLHSAWQQFICGISHTMLLLMRILVFCDSFGRYCSMFSVDINAWGFSSTLVGSPSKIVGYCEIIMLPDVRLPGVMLTQHSTGEQKITLSHQPKCGVFPFPLSVCWHWFDLIFFVEN